MQTVIISLKEFRDGFTTCLDGKFQHDTLGLFNILKNGEVITRENNVKENEMTKKIWFDNQNRDYKITYDENDLDAAETEEAKAWSKHPMVEYPGNTNCKKPMFVMRNKGEEEKTDAILIKKRGQIYNLINNSSAEEMRNIAFVVGVNPVNKTVEEIFIKLLDFEQGVLMEDPDKFLNTFHTPDMQYIVIAKKAIIYGVITQEGNQFYLNNEIIGGSFEDVVAYLKMNEKMYENYVIPEVLKQDTLPANTDYTQSVNDLIGLKKTSSPIAGVPKKEASELDKLKDKEKSGNPPSENDELNQLKEEAKKLGIKAYWLMSYKTLKDKVNAIEAENQKEEVLV